MTPRTIVTLFGIGLLGAVAPVTAKRNPGPAEATNCNRLYVFGDSYSDTGFGYLDGNGPTAIAYAAHDIGITLLPANLGKPGDSLNYAVSGATTGRNAGQSMGRALLGFGILNQVAAFTADVREGRAKFDAATTVFFLAGGLNDSSFSTAQTIHNIGEQVEILYRAGARHFVIARLPVSITNFTVGKRLNPELPAAIVRFRTKFSGGSFELSDWGPMFDVVRVEGRRRNFSDTSSACAGRLIFGQDATPCRNPSARFFYHESHPSTEAHRQVGELLADEARRYWCSAIRRP